MTTLALSCRCGSVRGEAGRVTPTTGTHVICYCDDCQAFARFLGDAGDILDAWGGTPIYQMAQGRVVITAGADNIRCVRLTPKGMHRWYCGCCRTPIGNTLGPGAPFIGLIHTFLADEAAAGPHLGPVQGLIFTRFAGADAPDTVRTTTNSPTLLFTALRRILGWKLRGLGKPSPFFKNGKAVVEPEILATVS